MNRVPDMDFAYSAAEAKKTGVLILAALGLVLGVELGYVAWQFQNAEGERKHLVSESARLQKRLKQPAEVPVSREVNVRLAAAHSMVNNLSIPWEDLLSALEKAHGGAVIVESIRPDVEGRRVEIGVQSIGFSEISGFIERLSATRILEQVILVSETSGIDAKGSSRFVISASWAEGE